jgi:sialate O-acetylesterase
MNRTNFFTSSKPVFVIALFLCTAVLPAMADVKLPNIIGNDMVLQQNVPIQIWGLAEAGEKVNVKGSWQLLEGSCVTADANGKWKVQLPAAKAGGPYKLTVKGKNTIELTNILIGEVWVCSGQSNMHFALNNAFDGKETAEKANYPKIRLFTVPVNYSLKPQADTPSKWEVCSPKAAGDFSAIGFFFGLKLHNELNVPVGLIDSAVGGTAAELWTPGEALKAQPILAPILDRWDKADDNTKKLFGEGAEFDLQFDNFRFIPKSSEDKELLLDDFDDGDLVNKMNGQWGTESFEMADKTTINLIEPGSDGTGQSLRFSGHIRYGEFFHFGASFTPGGDPADLSDYQALSFDVRGKGFYRFLFNQPTIDDWDTYSAEIKKVSPDWEEVTIKFKDVKQAGWGVKKPFTPDQLSNAKFEPVLSEQGLTRPPSALYNGMIAPFVPFSIRGAIWHQGSANASRAYQYRTVLPTMITGWRDVWGQGDFPFIIVQTQKFKKRKPLPSEDDWAELREAQLMTALGLPNTGLAVAVDIGNPYNIHQKKKKDVAGRLALWALGTTYGKNIVYSGPLYESMEIINDRIKLKFKHTGSGLIAKGGSELKGFAIAGADQEFHWANAEIENDTVVVSSEKVPKPVAVRYGWQANPDCNLYNLEGLPASPFRTDNWPGITVDRN